jgi:hypothetical protein
MPALALTSWRALIDQCDARQSRFFIRWLRHPGRTQLSRAERALLIRLFRQVAFQAAGQ